MQRLRVYIYLLICVGADYVCVRMYVYAYVRTCMRACDLTPPTLERIKTTGLNMMCISNQGPTMFFG
jgi:hypothetical protein